MRKTRWMCLLGLLLLPCAQARAEGWHKGGNEVQVLNMKIAGKVMDFTANHGKDHRMLSRVLWQRRDLYVYLPPGYQPCQEYPFMIWLHGFCEDERAFLRRVVPVIDAAICSGKLPPLIVAAPDGTFKGKASLLHGQSFFLNSPQGDFADFVLQDVWDFVVYRYPVRHEREAHILAGVSMGGFAAYNLAIKHREAFGTVIGIMPPLNMRWANKKGNICADFNPRVWGWKNEPTSKLKGIAVAPLSKAPLMHNWIESLYGRGDSVIWAVANENPIEMINRYQVAPCQLEMYVAYGCDDHYNIDAQVESFLYFMHWRGLKVCVGYQKHAPHMALAAKKFLPGALEWLAPRIAPYSPVCACEEAACCDDDCTCGPDCGPTPTRRRFLRRRLRSPSDLSCGYPHSLPDPAPPMP